MKKQIKELILVFNIIFFSLSAYSQSSELNNGAKIKKIDNYVKFIDSTSINKKEGIIEGVIKYSHGESRAFGWEAYYLNDENNNDIPLRIKYNESKPQEIEKLNLYYHNGELIYGELIVIKINKKSEPLKENCQKYYFEKGDILDCNDINISNITYILDKQKILIKSIYE